MTEAESESRRSKGGLLQHPEITSANVPLAEAGDTGERGWGWVRPQGQPSRVNADGVDTGWAGARRHQPSAEGVPAKTPTVPRLGCGREAVRGTERARLMRAGRGERAGRQGACPAGRMKPHSRPHADGDGEGQWR